MTEITEQKIPEPIPATFMEASKTGEPVAQFLSKLDVISASPYLIYGIWSATQGEWGLAASSLAGLGVVTAAYEKLYSSYNNSSAENQSDLRSRIKKVNLKIDRFLEKGWDLSWSAVSIVIGTVLGAGGAAGAGDSLLKGDQGGTLGGLILSGIGFFYAYQGVSGEMAKHLKEEMVKRQREELNDRLNKNRRI